MAAGIGVDRRPRGARPGQVGQACVALPAAQARDATAVERPGAVGPELQRNIDFHYYEAGHMIFAHPQSFETLRANIGRFIAETSAPR